MLKLLGRILSIILILVVVLALVLGGVGFFTVRRSFPQMSGEIQVPGLTAPVEVYRDSYGVPHIYAQTTHDLFLAQGYVHAQDRFWQMDFWRHVGSGRLAELFGESLVETDAYLRTLGWARVSTQEVAQLDPVSREILESYTEGVNAYLAEHQGAALSLEYAVLKLQNGSYQPEPWQPLHTLTWAKAMAWNLGGNMDVELHRAELLSTLTPEQVESLFPPYPADHPVIVPGFQLGTPESSLPAASSARVSVAAQSPIGEQEIATASTRGGASGQTPALAMTSYLEVAPGLEAMGQQSAALEALLGPMGLSIGSNSWAVSGARTTTGQPILANDPHLGVMMPSIWYEVGLHCTPKGSGCPYELTGVSFAGVPGIVIGHNDRIAWGFTNVGPDVQDLYIEKINPANPDQYEYQGQWIDMEIVREMIHVADGDPVELTVRYTRHGPLIWQESLDELREEVGLDLPETFAIALRWTALEPGTTFQSVWRINRAQNWEEFRDGVSYFDVPSQNMLYADVEGNIGYQTPGRIPIRAAGHTGELPVPGWTGENEWQGFIPFEELPRSFNPPEGYIVTANNAVVGTDYPYLLGTNWDAGFRAQRIVDLIEQAGEGAASPAIDLAYIQQMQGDDRSPMADELLPVVLGLSLDEPRLDEAQALLADWDRQESMDSAAAALFEVFWKHLLFATFDELGEEDQPGGGAVWYDIVRRLVPYPADAWWDVAATAEVEGRDTVFRQAFAAAVDELEGIQGKDPAGWGWGDLHTITFRHEAFGEVGIAPIEAIFNRGPYACAGGEGIVNATGWAADESYQVDSIPSMRMIVDLSNLNNSLMMHTTGQSGHAYHANYIDMADPWRYIEYHPMLWDRTQVEGAAEAHLTLRP
jgi:penicillin amidase